MIDIPYNEMAERAVLGSLMVHQDLIKLYIERDLPNDVFFKRDHVLLIEIILDLYSKDGVAETPLIVERINSDNIEKHFTGGIDYLFELIQNVTTKDSFDFYLNILEEKHKLRMLVDVSEQIKTMALDNKSSLDDVLFQSEDLIKQVSKSNISNSMIKMSDVVVESKLLLEKVIANKGQITGLKTGFTELDRVTGGLHGGAMIVLGSRPGLGKSALAMNIALNVSRINFDGLATVGVFSLEMPAIQLTNRLLSNVSGINGLKIRDGNIRDDEYNKILSAYKTLESLNIEINKSSSSTMADIFKQCRAMKNEGGLDLVVIDYLQLITGKHKSGSNRQNEVSEISRQLKQLALELDVPVLALSQLSRSIEQRQDPRPMLSDLRESGSIEQDKWNKSDAIIRN